MRGTSTLALRPNLQHANDEMLAKMKMGKVEKRMIKTTDGKDMLDLGYLPARLRSKQKVPNASYTVKVGHKAP